MLRSFLTHARSLLRRIPRGLWWGLTAALGLAVLLPLGGALWLRSEGAHARLREALLPRLEARLGRVELGETWHPGLTRWVLGPLTVYGPDDGLAPLLHAERIVVTPSWQGLLRDAPIAALALEEVVVELGPRASRHNWLRSQLSGKALPTDSRSAESNGARQLPPVTLRDVRVRLGAAASLGPAEVSWTPADGPRPHSVAASWDRAKLSATLVRSSEETGGWALDARWSQVPLEPFVSLLRPGLVPAGESAGTLRWEGLELAFEVRVREAAIAWARLSPEPVGPLDLALTGRVDWEPEARALSLPELSLRLGRSGEVQLPLAGHFPLAPTTPFTFSATLPPTSFRALARSLPEAIAPREQLEGIDGPLAATLSVSGPRADPAAWEVEASLELDALREAMRGRPTRLAGTFELEPLVDDEARGRTLRVGPSNPFFVPVSEVPHVLERAVLLSEDSFFYGHPGFDIPSLTRNLLQPREGNLRGGSTLTQQLAKNLFLSREKTYARKLREAFLTVALEASLPKSRLLEIYLNVIEWGPDVYGLGEAAWHYFGKDARALSTREALFLATIIPNPIRYHGYCSRGALSERWEERMGQLFDKMIDNGELDPIGAAVSRHQPLVFAHRSRADAFFEPLGMAEPMGDGGGEDREATR